MKWSLGKFPYTPRVGIMGVIVIALLVVLFISARATCPRGCNERSFGCAIKGNITPSGKKIYHLTGDKYYNQTVINPARGEMYFCTEEEARANGFRKALQP